MPMCRRETVAPLCARRHKEGPLSARSSGRLRATLYADVEREWNVRRLRGNDAGSRNVTQWNRLPRSRGSSAVLGNAANLLRFIELSRKAYHANADPRYCSELNQHFPHRLNEAVRYDGWRLIRSGPEVKWFTHRRHPRAVSSDCALLAARVAEWQGYFRLRRLSSLLEREAFPGVLENISQESHRV